MTQRPGWKTTEFWSKNVVQILAASIAAYNAYNANGLPVAQQAQVAAAAIAVIGWVEGKYSESRGRAKQQQTGEPK